MWFSMAQISAYILSLVGIVFLGVLVDVIMPDGEMNGFVKGMFALIAMLIIIAPIGKLKNKNFKLEDIFEQTTSIQIDGDFLEATKKDIDESLKNQLVAKLEDEGFCKIIVTIESMMSNNVYQIEKVKISVANLSNLDKQEHINKCTKIKEIAEQILNVEESDVIIDE